MLQGHVLDLGGQELAVLLTVVEDVAGRVGMDMRLDDAPFAEGDDAVAHAVQPRDETVEVKAVDIHLRALQPQEELGTVAVLQLHVLGESVEIHARGRGIRRAGGVKAQSR